MTTQNHISGSNMKTLISVLSLATLALGQDKTPATILVSPNYCGQDGAIFSPVTIPSPTSAGSPACFQLPGSAALSFPKEQQQAYTCQVFTDTTCGNNGGNVATFNTGCENSSTSWLRSAKCTPQGGNNSSGSGDAASTASSTDATPTGAGDAGASASSSVASGGDSSGASDSGSSSGSSDSQSSSSSKYTGAAAGGDSGSSDSQTASGNGDSNAAASGDSSSPDKSSSSEGSSDSGNTCNCDSSSGKAGKSSDSADAADSTADKSSSSEKRSTKNDETLTPRATLQSRVFRMN